MWSFVLLTAVNQGESHSLTRKGSGVQIPQRPRGSVVPIVAGGDRSRWTTALLLFLLVVAAACTGAPPASSSEDPEASGRAEAARLIEDAVVPPGSEVVDDAE